MQFTITRAGLAEADARARVDAAVTATRAARDKAAANEADPEKAALDAAETARKNAILTALLLTAMSLVSGAAAYIAAVNGGRVRDAGRVFSRFAYRKGLIQFDDKKGALLPALVLAALGWRLTRGIPQGKDHLRLIAASSAPLTVLA